MSNAPKVRWQREENGSAVPYMFEDLGNKRWGWIRYSASRIRQPDRDFLSKGYSSFLAAKKAGYLIDLPKL